MVRSPKGPSEWAARLGQSPPVPTSGALGAHWPGIVSSVTVFHITLTETTTSPSDSPLLSSSRWPCLRLFVWQRAGNSGQGEGRRR
jgi:hypothetical protein